MVPLSSKRSIGVVQWVRAQEYGLVQDGFLNEKVFFHCADNPLIGKLTAGSLCAYQIQPNRRRGGWEATDIAPLKEVASQDVYTITHDNFHIVPPQPALPLILPYLAASDHQRFMDRMLYDIDRVNSAAKYSEAVAGIQLTKCLGETAMRSFVQKLVSQISEPYRFKLWIDGHVDEIATTTLKANFFLASKPERDRASRSLTSTTLLGLFLSMLHDEDRIVDLTEDSNYVEMLERANAWPLEERSQFVDLLWEKSSEAVQLQLWLHGFSERFDLGVFRLQFLLLSPEEQILFIRRLMKAHEAKKQTVTVETLHSLIRFEHDPADDQNIDCSVDIALQAILDLHEGKPLSVDHQIGPVLAKHFDRKAFSKYRIKDLFDRCEGRGHATAENASREGEPKKVAYHRSDKVPAGVIYCEGRKAPEPDRTYGVSFWFCRNTPCFMPCNQGRHSTQWEKYTLRDMLRVLELPFDEDQYQTFLGYINRVNDLLSHLNCRSCGKILTPARQSTFAFYRATRFACTNPTCLDKAEVYLSHCLHPRCGKVVDSRDSAKCPNGWHVCPNCFSCCSTAKLGKRLERLGGTAPENLRKLVLEAGGHLEKGVHFCFKCGSELEGGNEKYRQTLKWLIANTQSDPRIWKSDRQTDGAWWFVVDFPEEKYANLIALGFEVKPMRSGNARLLSEPRNRKEFTLGTCPNSDCDRHGVQSQAQFAYIPRA